MDKISGKIKFDYDKNVDVLYSYIDKPRMARSEEVQNGVLIRIDTHINKIVGFTIIDFKRRIKDGLIKTIPCFEEININNLVKQISHQ